MLVTINISCETEEELYAHLQVIKETFTRKFETEVDLNELFDPFTFRDENCYGWHEVDVIDADLNNE